MRSAEEWLPIYFAKRSYEDNHSLETFIRMVQQDALASQPEARWNDKVAQLYSPKACRTCQSPFREGCMCTFCGDTSPHCKPIPKPTVTPK